MESRPHLQRDSDLANARAWKLRHLASQSCSLVHSASSSDRLDFTLVLIADTSLKKHQQGCVEEPWR